MSRRIRISNLLAILSLLGLLALIFSWIIWFVTPPHWPRPLLILLAALPLALPLRGMLYRRYRSHLLAAYLSLLYALHGGSELWVAERLWLPLLEVVLALSLFFSCALFVRFSRNENPELR
ncbi:MAG: DUF2069 domain-containing protein [Gammaproteobacteria bacterium]|nr:DUF2069 domain-containing protein [Gammaproteobacteria bacterium]